jgi:YHS domain-containing protein
MSQTHVPAKDPVCGMVIDASTAAAVQEWKGKTYFFCSTSCASTFRRETETQAASAAGRCGGACCG